MEVILKTTGKCNFACDFCLAKNAKIGHCSKVPQAVIDQLRILNPQQIIVNGGEPLMSGPGYFDDLLQKTECQIGIVTNLKDFFIDPDKWERIFSNPRVSVTTSFQYGARRKYDADTPYTEDMFIGVCEKFKAYFGYVPMFIAVISEENEKFALDHVYLARKLGTKCKLNGMMPVGISHEHYPLYKMVDIWLKVVELGLTEYYDYDVQFARGGCSFNTCLRCSSTIRVCYVDENGRLMYSDCETKAMQNAFIPADKAEIQPAVSGVRNPICAKCYGCRLFRLCNGCDVEREFSRGDASFCDEMKKRESGILNSGWYIG